jgi:hypothetical protein
MTTFLRLSHNTSSLILRRKNTSCLTVAAFLLTVGKKRRPDIVQVLPHCSFTVADTKLGFLLFLTAKEVLPGLILTQGAVKTTTESIATET